MMSQPRHKLLWSPTFRAIYQAEIVHSICKDSTWNGKIGTLKLLHRQLDITLEYE